MPTSNAPTEMNGRELYRWATAAAGLAKTKSTATGMTATSPATAGAYRRSTAGTGRCRHRTR